MKKNLILLAVFAASVAAAADEKNHLDFSASTVPTTFTFNGNSTDEITLVGVTTLNGTTLSDADHSVTVNGQLFNDKSGGIGVLKSATINLGSGGSLVVKGDVNFGTDTNNFAFTFTLPELIVETDDASLDGELGFKSYNIFKANSGNYQIWNWEKATYTATSVTEDVAATWAGQKVQDYTGEMNKAGAYTVWSGEETKNGETYSYIDVRYAFQYKYVGSDTEAVPEPTTATLSLLALAGLAARRRRK